MSCFCKNKRNGLQFFLTTLKYFNVLPCFTDTYLAFDAATKLACGNESSKENNSSLVTVGDLVFKTDLEPIGAK